MLKLAGERPSKVEVTSVYFSVDSKQTFRHNDPQAAVDIKTTTFYENSAYKEYDEWVVYLDFYDLEFVRDEPEKRSLNKAIEKGFRKGDIRYKDPEPEHWLD